MLGSMSGEQKVYVRFDIEPLSHNEGYAVCEFVDQVPNRQVTVVGGRFITSLVPEDAEVGPTLTELALDENWREEEPELVEIEAHVFERIWRQALA